MPRVSAEQIARLLATAATASYEDVRDRALMWLFIATDAEPSELARLGTDDLDLARGRVGLRDAKGTSRTHELGPEALTALRGYLAARARWPHAAVSGFWLAGSGEMSSSDIVRVARERGARAGVGDVLHPPHPH